MDADPGPDAVSLRFTAGPALALALALGLVLAGCGGEDEQARLDRGGAGAPLADAAPEIPVTLPDRRTAPGWVIGAGEEAYEGDLSVANAAGDTLVIQLVNRDAVNLGIQLSGPPGERRVDDAFFAVGRGPSCHLVVSEPPFRVELDEREEGWLSGEFAGMLACPDYTPLSVRGAFHVPAPGA